MNKSKEPSSQDIKGPISREILYELAWSEPMTSIGKKLSVSSSYLARIYTRLNVPRPAPGYWAKVAAGATPFKPDLPAAQPGDETIWDRSGSQSVTAKPTPALAPTNPRKRPKRVKNRPSLHPLIRGAKEHFQHTRKSESKYLRPYKRLLVDMIISEDSLELALDMVNQLFFALEDYDHRVKLNTSSEPCCRHGIDDSDLPSGLYYQTYWSPDCCTIVYVGSVAIGLTFIELSKTLEARYVKGEYLPISDPRAIKHSKHAHSWTTEQSFPSGEFCLQAYSPYLGTEWFTQWKISTKTNIKTLGHKIARELNEHAPLIVDLQKEALRKAEIRRLEYEDYQRQEKIEQALREKEKAETDSRQDLLEIIEQWSEAKRIGSFIDQIESEIHLKHPDQQQLLLNQLDKAKQFLGNLNALDAIAQWRSPEDRLRPTDTC